MRSLAFPRSPDGHAPVHACGFTCIPDWVSVSGRACGGGNDRAWHRGRERNLQCGHHGYRHGRPRGYVLERRDGEGDRRFDRQQLDRYGAPVNGSGNDRDRGADVGGSSSVSGGSAVTSTGGSGPTTSGTAAATSGSSYRPGGHLHDRRRRDDVAWRAPRRAALRRRPAAAAASGAGSSGTSGGSTTTGGATSSGTSTGATSGSTTGAAPCQVPVDGETDPCFANGLAWHRTHGALGGGHLSRCRPRTISVCHGRRMRGEQCHLLPSAGAQAGSVDYCFQDCATTSSCGLPFQTCYEGHCLFNECGPTIPGGGNYYGACQTTDGVAGVCLPFEDPTYGLYGACLVGASADAGAPAHCSQTSDGGDLCPLGTFCFIDYETTATECQPICEATPAGSDSAGPGCAAGQVCVKYPTADFGTCAPSCPVPDQAADCPPLDNCLVTGQTYPDGGLAYTCEP